jgi:outer membrane protein assembly factor BamB
MAGSVRWPPGWHAEGGDPRGHAFVEAEFRGLKLRWTVSVGIGITCRPVVAEGVVYAAGEDGSIHGFDQTGQALGSGGEALSMLHGGPARGSPAYRNGVLFVAKLSGDLFAVDARTGKVRAQERVGAAVVAAPAVADELLVVATVSGEVVAFEANTLRKRWGIPALGSPFLRPPVLCDDRWVGVTERGTLVVIENRTGEVVLRAESECRVRSGPIAFAGFATVVDIAGTVWIIEADRAARVDRGVTGCGGMVLGTASANGANLLVGLADGRVVSVDSRGGSCHLVRDLAARRMDSISLGTTTFRNAVAVLTDHFGLYVLRCPDGDVLYSIEIPPSKERAVGMVSDGICCYVARGRHIDCLALAT